MVWLYGMKNNDEVIASLGERILGRVSVHDVIHPLTGEVIVRAGEEIREDAAKRSKILRSKVLKSALY